ncbi:hypothetical protein SARC_04785 [Sphaeroforma arctica JP610]|uniref:Uncharacterized protein n=1 Tax=Sphaeroforma arctica JP610 TaxID=667725 RepID=A0A0L0G3Y4_9EUKA|nr:hypothetical protein SARC_04785 [Sphaeroforma arctica JP610]KNC82938.1 hypothetical protein SARC_04785 [Sphaeroforma arctica JP610]|eukprot:XP_014156840.1 hypothetical protein SARC_04785 [Sphaeroforma arctica JP610]
MDMRASAHDNNAHQMGHANTSPPARDYGNQYKPPPSQYTQQQSTVQISRDDSVDRRPSGLQTASWVTRWKRKLGIRPLALMGRDFTRLAIVCLGVLCLYLLMQR